MHYWCSQQAAPLLLHGITINSSVQYAKQQHNKYSSGVRRIVLPLLTKSPRTLSVTWQVITSCPARALPTASVRGKSANSFDI
jgi:hypothetical protein